MKRGLTEKCAHCGYSGKVGAELAPYFIETKVLKKAYRKPVKKGKGWVDVPEKTKAVHRWLCGLQTGRACSTLWHDRFREWSKARGQG